LHESVMKFERILFLVLTCAASGFGQTAPPVVENVVYEFQATTTTYEIPTTGLVADNSGNLYGSLFDDLGVYGRIYQLSPPSQEGAPWTYTTIYTFQGGADGDAAGPGALTTDSSGNVYGTTSSGGTSTNCNLGCGTVFELSRPSEIGGLWTKTTLYSFGGGPTDGQNPNGYLILDKAGNLYGMTQAGGNPQCNVILPGCGLVFELSPPSSPAGNWTETVLHFFQGGIDGANPYAGLTFDAQGRLYGTTAYGGQSAMCRIFEGCGAVFSMQPPTRQGDNWGEEVLLRFNNYIGTGGLNPRSTLTIQRDAIYGTTYNGLKGPVIFQLSVQDGVPTETVLSTYPDFCLAFNSGVVSDPSGNLYGVVISANNACNSYSGVYELSPPQINGGAWTLTNLPMPDGTNLVGGLTLFDKSIYGAAGGGVDRSCELYGACGLVYSYTSQK